MGPDDEVGDAGPRVRGGTGLRMMDASVLPIMVSGGVSHSARCRPGSAAGPRRGEYAAENSNAEDSWGPASSGDGTAPDGSGSLGTRVAAVAGGVMFVGRAGLLQFIDQLVRPTESSDAGVLCPLITLEGCGGSGRTATVDEIYTRWHERTPTVLVRPLERPYDEQGPIRPVLTAAMLGLTPGISGYSMAFKRTLVAQIAISIDFSAIPVADQRDHLRSELNRYRHRESLVQLVDNLLTVAGDQAAGLGVPGAAIVAPFILQQLNEFLVRRMVHGTWLTRITWRAAVPWFGHQDLGLQDSPEEVLIRLSLNAGSEDTETRSAIDDLLLSAFLADVRECAGRTQGRRPRVLILLDDGDAPASVAFLGSLLRTRRSLAAARVHDIDPLAVIATSSGLLAQQLSGDVQVPQISSEPPDAEFDSTSQKWLRLGLPEFSGVKVENLARHVDSVTPTKISGPVHRLTGGHPATTSAVLDRIRDDPALVVDLDAVLAAPGPAPAPTFREHLLRPFVRALSPRRSVDADLREALVTISAARTKQEAKLLVPVLPDGVGDESVLFESPSLWTTADDEARQELPPVVRMLGLRILAARTDPEHSWSRIFQLLYVGTRSDRVANLYYKRLLQGSTAIVDDLLESLQRLPTEQWLSEFDRIVSVFDPRRTDHAVLAAPDHGTEASYRLGVLLAATSVFESDPSVTTRVQKARLCHRIEASYQALAPLATDGNPLRARHARFDKLATQFS